MVKIIIELRDLDVDNNVLNNSNAINEISNHANKYWNCESIGIEESKA